MHSTKLFFFGSLSSSSSSSSKPKSPRSSKQRHPMSPPSPSSPSPPIAETRVRSGSTGDQPTSRRRSIFEAPSTRKRSGTIASTVDHFTSFWEGKNEKKERLKEAERQLESEKHKGSEKQEVNPKPIAKTSPVGGKEPVKSPEREGRKGHKEESKDIKRTKEVNVVISNEVLTAVKGPSELKTKSEIKSRNEAKTKNIDHIKVSTSSSSSSSFFSTTSITPTTTITISASPTLSTTTHEPQMIARVKHKAKSEGSLIAGLFSRKLERGGLMQKSSSLIEMKALTATPTTKSGSAIQIGKKKGYFGVTLQEAMEMQKEKYPFLLIPVIMAKLTDAILLFEGCKAEGIFRVAGSAQQVFRLQQQFNEMNFDEISPDPHVLVGVLKQWLRELKEPLIPNSIYYDCLSCETTTDCLEVIKQLPELNKAVFAHFVVFLRIIVKPEYFSYTRMDVNSLCLVTAPVLFRCPSTDIAGLVVNNQREKLFLHLVMESPAFI